MEDYPNERFQRDKSLFEKFKIVAKDIFTYLCSDNWSLNIHILYSNYKNYSMCGCIQDASVRPASHMKMGNYSIVK